MNILFLDCDGVINNQDFLDEWKSVHGDSRASLDEFKKLYYVHDGFKGYVVPELLERVWDICDVTDCHIVWSSSWRTEFASMYDGSFIFDWNGIERLWKAKGMPFGRLVDCTPCLDSSRFSYTPRGVEIQRWLDDNVERFGVNRAAIVDDDEDAGIGIEHSGTRMFQTSFQHGLTEDIALSVVEWLNG